MVKIYDIIKNNLLLIAVMLWAVIFAIMAYPEPKEEVNKTIIQIEIDLEKIDGSLKNIEQTIQEIFGKLEIEINTGE
jgi:hypothetical protein